MLLMHGGQCQLGTCNYELDMFQLPFFHVTVHGANEWLSFLFTLPSCFFFLVFHVKVCQHPNVYSH